MLEESQEIGIGHLENNNTTHLIHTFKNKKVLLVTMTKYLVTSALPYVNNVPHLGNLVCIISADVYTRYLRLQKRDVLSIIGTDEHGTTSQIKAMEEGVTPQEVCDKYFAIHKEIYEWFNTEFDCIGRTSSKTNHEVSQEIFMDLLKNGFLLQKTTKQYFDEEKQMFLADRFVTGTCPHCAYTDARGDQCDSCGKLLEPRELTDPKSTLSKSTPVIRESIHFYIDLPLIEPKLQAWIKEKEKSWSENARQITKAWLHELLQPRGITRDLKWGVPVPLDEFKDKVLYSWFDAPIGYISILKENRDDWKDWWFSDTTRLIQFMGKDNVQFHTILFPSFLLGTQKPYTLVDTISANEFLNYADGKFSKSRNTGVFGDAAMKTGIPADCYRYYLMAIRPEKEDTTFDWQDFGQKINKELIDNYANLVNRVISFTNKFFDGAVPQITQDEDYTEQFAQVAHHYEHIELKQAVKQLLTISKSLNIYFQENEPWKTVKTDKEKAANTLAVLANKVYDLTIALSPIIPKVAQEVFTQLNVSAKSHTWDHIGTNPLQDHKLGTEKPLLAKLEADQIKKLRTQFGEKKDEFQALLKVAKIESVVQHPNADKLYVIHVDVGDHKRQILSGLRDYYKPEDLVNKQVVIVANLKPAKIRGERSEGMLLAGIAKPTAGKFQGEKQEKEPETEELEIINPKFSKPGDIVAPAGFESNTELITIDEFAKLKLKIQDKKVVYDGKVLATKAESLTSTFAQGIVE
ncbi:MAG: methionyl-tRNA synthetase [Candidatus Woesearchaeota archaeon]|jgi:methionyl-tRNA synthetase